MKRIILLLLALTFAVSASAQYASLQRKGTVLAANGGRLSSAEMAAVLSDIGGVDCNTLWYDAARKRNTGVGLTIGGAVVTLGGGLCTMAGLGSSLIGSIFGGVIGSIGGEESSSQAAKEGAKGGKPLTIAGIAAGVAGLATTVTGISMWSSNNKKMDGIVDRYNAGQPRASLTLGPTAGGFGLQLSF